MDQIKEEPEEFHRVKFIFLCTEGVRHFREKDFEKLRVILKKKNIHLLVFNIANQNLNMLYLRKLQQLSPLSQFFLNEKEFFDYLDKLRGQQFMKKIYVEFF